MEREKWVWMPHPGHFICAHNCRFHLHTYVGRFVVSTVGEMWPDSTVRRIYAESRDPAWMTLHGHLRGDPFDHEYMERFGYEEIGYGRKYETMVFNADEHPGSCCPWRQRDGRELDTGAYNTSEDAFRGHLEMCEKWSKEGL